MAKKSKKSVTPNGKHSKSSTKNRVIRSGLWNNTRSASASETSDEALDLAIRVLHMAAATRPRYQKISQAIVQVESEIIKDVNEYLKQHPEESNSKELYDTMRKKLGANILMDLETITHTSVKCSNNMEMVTITLTPEHKGIVTIKNFCGGVLAEYNAATGKCNVP